MGGEAVSVSGNGCEKCGYTGCVPFGDDAPWSMMRPCDACAEPWGPQPLDAPDRDGLWWLQEHEGLKPEPVRVVLEDESFTAQRIGDAAIIYAGDISSEARWLPLTAPEVPR